MNCFQCRNMKPTEKSTILSQLNDDLAFVCKSAAPVDDDEVEKSKKDHNKCAAYITQLFIQLDEGTDFGLVAI